MTKTSWLAARLLVVKSSTFEGEGWCGKENRSKTVMRGIGSIMHYSKDVIEVIVTAKNGCTTKKKRWRAKQQESKWNAMRNWKK